MIEIADLVVLGKAKRVPAAFDSLLKYSRTDHSPLIPFFEESRAALHLAHHAAETFVDSLWRFEEFGDIRVEMNGFLFNFSSSR